MNRSRLLAVCLAVAALPACPSKPRPAPPFVPKDLPGLLLRIADVPGTRQERAEAIKTDRLAQLLGSKAFGNEDLSDSRNARDLMEARARERLRTWGYRAGRTSVLSTPGFQAFGDKDGTRVISNAFLFKDSRGARTALDFFYKIEASGFTKLPQQAFGSLEAFGEGAFYLEEDRNPVAFYGFYRWRARNVVLELLVFDSRAMTDRALALRMANLMRERAA